MSGKFQDNDEFVRFIYGTGTAGEGGLVPLVKAIPYGSRLEGAVDGGALVVLVAKMFMSERWLLPEACISTRSLKR